MVTTLTTCIAVPLLLLLWSHGGTLRRSPWPAVLVILWYGYRLAHIAGDNIRAPHEWDYACFWLYGHIAAARLNVYDPAVFRQFALPFTPSPEFHAAVLNVGFPYPPPTMTLFLPLGYVRNLSTGLALWYVVQFAALAGAAWVLARTFMPAYRWRSALLVLALVTALPAAVNTVGDAQTNFIVLLFVALALRGRTTRSGAIWQTLALWVKPFSAALFLLDLLRGRWTRLMVAAITAVVSLAVGALIVGPAALASYLLSNPSTREPAFAFVEVVNQSLLAAVLRLQAAVPQHVSPFHEPFYLAAALAFAVLTVAACARPGVRGDIAFAAMLLLGLIVYPGTLSSYGVMLTVPLLVVWKYRAAFPGGTGSVCGIIALTVFLSNLTLQRGFEANVLAWIACSYLLIVRHRDVRGALTAPLRTTAAQRVESVG